MILFRSRRALQQHVAAIAFACVFAAPVQALTVDTGPGSDDGGGWSLYDDRPATAGHQSLAARFSVDASDTITSVQGWLNWAYGGRITFALQTDFAGLPGARLHSVTLELPATALNVPDWRGVGGLNWEVSAGDYWLVFEDTRGPGSGSMPAGAADPLLAYASSPGLLGTTWMRADTLNFGVRINTFPEPPPAPAPVPLPAAWVLLSGGLALVRRYCRPATTPRQAATHG